MKNKQIFLTLLSVVLGLIVGGIALAISGYNPLEAYGIMVEGIFSRPRYISWTVIRSVPIILTGLSVAFAFRTGLFNIGAEGQYIVGAVTAALAGYFLELPAGIHAVVVIVIAMVAAGVWGGIAGLLKSKFGVHEVISTIMLNWIALYLNNYIVFWDKFRRPQSEASQKILETAQISILGDLRTSGNEFIRGIFSTPVNLGIAFAVLAALFVWYTLNKTTLGYELRAVGYNRHASEYGGINVNRSIVISMVISGALAGLGGATQVLGVTKEVSVLAAMEGNGFDGIAVALLGNTTPLGSVLAGLLFGGLKYGGPKIQPSLGAPSEVIDIMIGSIVFFTAMPNFIKVIAHKLKKKRGEAE